VLAEFAINNKAHLTTKMSLFIVNYGRELRIGIDIRRRRKMKKAMEFAERIKKIQEEVGAALKKAQEKMKQQADRGRRDVEMWKAGNRMMLSIKDLIFKERPAKKLIDYYVGPYIIDEIVLTNVVKLQLLVLMKIHLVVNVS